MSTFRVHNHWAALLMMTAFTFSPLSAQADPAGANPARAAINALISASDGPLPAGTRLKSISIADGLATVDFSHELRNNFHGGDTEEAVAVNGILRALGQYPTVSRVQILVAGQPVESLGGMLVISKPLAVIRPAGFVQTGRMFFHRRPVPQP